MDAPYTESESFRAATNLCRRITERDGGGHDRLDTDIMGWLMREPDRLAAKDAEIERLRRDLSLAAQHAAAADAECERRIAAHQAAEAEVARLKGINELQADLLNGAIKRARDERERCARVAENARYHSYAPHDHPTRIAAAIRAG